MTRVAPRQGPPSPGCYRAPPPRAPKRHPFLAAALGRVNGPTRGGAAARPRPPRPRANYAPVRRRLLGRARSTEDHPAPCLRCSSGRLTTPKRRPRRLFLTTHCRYRYRSLSCLRVLATPLPPPPPRSPRRRLRPTRPRPLSGPRCSPGLWRPSRRPRPPPRRAAGGPAPNRLRPPRRTRASRGPALALSRLSLCRLWLRRLLRWRGSRGQNRGRGAGTRRSAAQATLPRRPPPPAHPRRPRSAPTPPATDRRLSPLRVPLSPPHLRSENRPAVAGAPQEVAAWRLDGPWRPLPPPPSLRPRTPCRTPEPSLAVARV
mmetsp:Transcript_47583/g.107937  ORF Transcript_47583/g.107937 Transcript_47583/m.107937 type:complete len:317 (-) Transcript_47583:172-1122(-)